MAAQDDHEMGEAPAASPMPHQAEGSSSSAAARPKVAFRSQKWKAEAAKRQWDETKRRAYEARMTKARQTMSYAKTFYPDLFDDDDEDDEDGEFEDDGNDDDGEYEDEDEDEDDEEEEAGPEDSDEDGAEQNEAMPHYGQRVEDDDEEVPEWLMEALDELA